MVKGKGDRRNLFIHLLKNKTGITKKEIAEFIGGLSYSGVSTVEVQFVEKLKKNKLINKDLKAVFYQIANVKG